MNKIKPIAISILFFALIYAFISIKSFYHVENLIETYQNNVEALDKISSQKTIKDIFNNLKIDITNDEIAIYRHILNKEYTDKENNKYIYTNRIVPFNKEIYLKTDDKITIQTAKMGKYKGYAGGLYFLAKDQDNDFFYLYHPDDVSSLYNSNKNSNQIIFSNDISDVGLVRLFDITEYETVKSEVKAAKEELKSYISTNINENKVPVTVHAFIDNSEPNNIKEFYKNTLGSTLLYWFQDDLENKLRKKQAIKLAEEKNKKFPFEYVIYFCIIVFIFSVLGKTTSSVTSKMAKGASSVSKVANSLSGINSGTDSGKNDEGKVGEVILEIDDAIGWAGRKYDIDKKDGFYHVRTELGNNNLKASSKSEIEKQINQHFSKRNNLKKIIINFN